MAPSIIDFSADFGGQDAADAVLPHFWALKTAARGLCFEGFPFPELAFILRVDGEVNTFGPPGAGHLDIDKDGEYLSVDIGVSEADRDQLPVAFAEALHSSVEQITTLAQARSWSVDIQALQQCLADLIERYENGIPSPEAQ